MNRNGDPSAKAKHRSLTESAGGLLAAAWVISTFAAAGTARWQAAWVYVAVVAAGLGAHRVFVASRNPEVLERRTSSTADRIDGSAIPAMPG